MNSFSFALRNLLRQRTRTGIAISAISVGVMALLLAGGFINWIFWAMRESTILLRLGHIQVVRPGYLEQGAADPFGFLLPSSSPGWLTSEDYSHIKALAPRLSFSGLISYSDTTVSFLGEGMDVEKEDQVNMLLSSQKSFGLPIDKPSGIVEGIGLSANEPNGITIGLGLANNLGVKPGDHVILLANTALGSINAVEAVINGIFTTSNKQVDDALLRLPLVMAQSLLRISGVHSWVLFLDDTSRTDQVLHDLRDNSALNQAQFQLVPWYTQSDFYNKTVVLFSRQMGVVRIIIVVIVILSISNLLGMSVSERTSEIGTLMAIGIKSNQIMKLFLSETALLGMVGTTLGVALGWGFGEIISFIGIPMPPAPGMTVGYTAEIRITLSLVASSFLIVLSATVIAGLYPAWRASQKNIVDSLRHGR
jgi:putative ABC transport system permease protein